MPRTAFADKLALWDLLNNGLKANAAELAHLAAQQKELESILNQARSLDAQQETLKSQLQQTTKQLVEAVAKADGLVTRLRSSLKGKYDERSAKLREFGLAPAKPGGRKKKSGG